MGASSSNPMSMCSCTQLGEADKAPNSNALVYSSMVKRNET